MLGFKIEGFDKLQKQLRNLQKNAGELNGTHEITLSELFPNHFISKFTKFSSLDDMFNASGFKVESAEDFKKIPDDEWDKFIQANTSFANWKEMQHKAAGEWSAKRLGL
ncbi:MAG TPA: hypothetical protein DEE98_04605 [Elusimicrobia bacterium]|nr:MAG: hypothetical protein A2278_04290 [Elusimicrobia bacterium RIFOXYA12_FULL_49_49]OGS10506.1 MAG: hypothetical protein A2386_05380 [Elusimicrobia bacterium RIFOXYB1_FULL_48_9]OGS14729.1 MAG: hypothetical protein A2251_09550 [Elusimicrobia bacterium RIFOXYA2_FULL_47_53]OGS25619.1 MAG: hypothetical protein A2339_06040 [Elusimicrobia bacterium RIFOXYB12_FULL_50_12]OGS31820.1 MAG: hypothetical protein A2323_06460 [Elusimicrobia bacterium RIFOXYB2_FULL_46_23]HBU69646.1 hypothetical protein [El